MSRRLVIAIDCDDVLIETTCFLVESYNKKFGTDVTLEHAHKPNNIEWGTDDDELMLGRLSKLQQTDEYARIEPIVEVVATVGRLAKEHELHLITARDGSVEAVTMAMLNKYLAGCFTTIEHVGKTRSKGEVCHRIGADVLIDDNIHYLMSAIENGLPLGGALHFGYYPWNQLDKPVEGVIECRDWEAVEREVLQIAAH